MAKKRTSKFRKGAVTANAHQQKTQGSQYGYLNLPSDIHIFKEEPSTRVRLDFVPYEVTDPKHPDRDDENEIAQVGDLWYKRPFRLHRNVGANNDAVVCPTSIGKRCPICDYRAKRSKEGADKDELQTMNASRRNLYVVIPRDVKKYEEEPHIWDIAQFLFQKELNDELDDNPDYGAFPDPEEGLTLRIRFGEGSFAGNKFAETSRIDFEERDPIEDDLMDRIPNLDEILTILPTDQIEAKFFEIEGEEETEDPPPRTRTQKKEDGEEEEPRLRRRGRTEGKEEEEEEEPPRRRRSREAEDDGGEERPRRRGGRESSSEDDDPPRRRRRDRDGEEEDPKEKAPRRSKRGKEDECPEGYEFGVDTDKHKECERCEVWEKCTEAFEAREAG